MPNMCHQTNPLLLLSQPQKVEAHYANPQKLFTLLRILNPGFKDEDLAKVGIILTTQCSPDECANRRDILYSIESTTGSSRLRPNSAGG